jgi:hypothetical protein
MSEPMYCVYVIELDGVPGNDPDKPVVYVGQSAVPPEGRFQQYLDGYKSSRYVRRYGVRLRPRLYRTHNPLPSRVAALEREKELARRLRKRGCTVFGGH